MWVCDSQPVVSLSDEALSSEAFFLESNPLGSSYPNNAHLSWILSPEWIREDGVIAPFEAIAINFTRFDLATGNDYVRIYRRFPNGRETLHQTLTGSIVPPLIYLQGTLRIEFVTDMSVNGAGFALLWYGRTYFRMHDASQTDLSLYIDTCKRPRCSFNAQCEMDGRWSCDSEQRIELTPNQVATEVYSLESNPEGSTYDNNANYWVDLAPTHGDQRDAFDTMSINFTRMDLEEHHDYVRLYTLSSYSVPKLYRSFTGHRLPRHLYIQSGRIRVEFHSDGNITRGGFSMQWRARKCGDAEPIGMIT